MASVTTIPSSPPLERHGLPFWMDRVVKQLHRVCASADAEAVHDARVAIRRCRSLASVLQEVDPFSAWQEMKRQPRKLFRALGALRDAHVLEEWVKHLTAESDPLRAKLLEILEDREAKSRARALRAAEKFDEKSWKQLGRTLRRRSRLVPPDGLAAQCLALERHQAAHELHARALRTEKPKPWHELRIGLKRFRYTLENLLPERYAAWEENLKLMQDLLGEVHDLDVLASLVDDVSAEGSFDSAILLRAAIVRERKERIEKYRQRTLGHAGLWQDWAAGLPRGMQREASAAARLRATARALDPHPRRTAQVSRLALRLFDALASSHSGSLFREPGARQILRAAGWLHGIGAAAGGNSPHKAARDTLSDLPPPPGWSMEDWQTLLWTVRFHRGAEPRPKHRAFAALPEGPQTTVRGLAGLLRLARALRRCGVDSPEGIRTEQSAEAVRLAVPGLMDTEENAARLAAGKHLLETYLKRPLLVEPKVKVISLPLTETVEQKEIVAASD